jgi:GNAT superfamily N-acetyltransferase
MKTIELTAENIEQYLERCVELQSHLLKDESKINPELLKKTAKCSHGYFMGVLNDEGVLLGVGLVSKVVDPVRIIAYVNNIVVHPDGRGQGLFGVIMDTLEAKAKDWGCTRMELTCSRQEVQGMYQKRGYTHKDTHFYYLNI